MLGATTLSSIVWGRAPLLSSPGNSTPQIFKGLGHRKTQDKGEKRLLRTQSRAASGAGPPPSQRRTDLGMGHAGRPVSSRGCYPQGPVPQPSIPWQQHAR